MHTFAPFKNGLTTATISDCLFGRNSEYLAGAYSDGCVRIFDLKSRKMARTYRNQNLSVLHNSMSGNHNSTLIAASSTRGIISLFKIPEELD